MEIEGGGSGSAETLGAGSGKKRPYSLRCGMCSPFIVDNFPRASWDHDEQSDLVFANPETKLRGPSPTMFFPPFKSGRHLFDSEYNLNDKSEISLTNVEDCLKECCCLPMDLIQFVDVKIAGYQHSRPGRAKIFGFVAARDTVKPLRNYIYRRAIDNCEAVPVKRKTGTARLSLKSPTRVISMSTRALVEFELHAQSEEEANGDDGPNIEGCTELYNMFESKSFIRHKSLYGERCALDIKYLVLMNAVEARVEVTVLRSAAIDDVVNMKLLAKTSGFSEVIRLFRGVAPKLGFMTSFVIAVERHSDFDLYIKGYPRDHPNVDQKLVPCSRWQCSFASGYHGADDEVAELGDFGAVSIKVTWRSHRKNSDE
ncbi:unnamed protein product [Miscanthus lutarioriparius]|uniref:DUF6598 domain-containing protein n=1 Tax=Miscanthus lutarioriparius TaxID=422564 RepID=A0A811RBE6_9POAL|nr:unnamed protein product [Miscanthus lutarioriparius]